PCLLAGEPVEAVVERRPVLVDEPLELCLEGRVEDVAAHGRSTVCHRYSPVSPSTDSRSRSAWPLCRAYSSIMWHTIQRRLGARPSGQERWASVSNPPCGSTCST